ncbi:MAG: Ig-like domain repeat protein [Betaproteobacteria bacterium]|nr:Ig-like domain repeat protein [Betaproteobacteria bacterium]
MKQQASFTGFDFASTWLIDEGDTEPYLAWAAVFVTGTTTSLISSANPGVLGQSVTFTATVTGNAPTGTVLFMDGAVPLAGCIAVGLAANQAQCVAGSCARQPRHQRSIPATASTPAASRRRSTRW